MPTSKNNYSKIRGGVYVSFKNNFEITNPNLQKINIMERLTFYFLLFTFYFLIFFIFSFTFCQEDKIRFVLISLRWAWMTFMTQFLYLRTRYENWVSSITCNTSDTIISLLLLVIPTYRFKKGISWNTDIPYSHHKNDQIIKLNQSKTLKINEHF